MDDTIGKVQNKAATIGLIVGGVLIVAVAVVALVMGQFNKKKVISSTSPAAPATLQNFDGGEKLGYIVGHPLDWEVQQPNDSAVIMGKYSGDDYTTLAIQNINTTDNGGSFATLDELVQEYQSQIRAADPKATFSDVNDFPSLKNQYGVDLQAKIYDAEYTLNDQKIGDRTIFVLHPSGKIFYAFAFKSTQFSANEDLGGQLLESWIIY